jgi:selT/selW/selH-like putative selenoprotein
MVGQTGDFEVKVDGRPVFSKQSQRRFPLVGEVEELVKKLVA